MKSNLEYYGVAGYVTLHFSPVSPVGLQVLTYVYVYLLVAVSRKCSPYNYIRRYSLVQVVWGPYCLEGIAPLYNTGEIQKKEEEGR